MTIHEIEQFFRSIGIKTKLSEYGLGIDAIDPIVERFKERKWQLGEAGNIDYEMIEKILRSRI